MNDSSTYASGLINGSYQIGVWGIGTIGFSSMVYFAEAGISALGYDVDANRVDSVHRSQIPVPGMSTWLSQDIRALVAKKTLNATTSEHEVLERCRVHLLGVPTEKDGEPHSHIIEDVIRRIGLHARARAKTDLAPLVIIESTLTPGTCADRLVPLLEELGLVVGEDILLAMAPRRDWFRDGGYVLKGLDRVFGGVTQNCANAAQSVLSLVCDRLHRASSAAVAEITKVVENAFRFVEIGLANQLALGFPHLNMVEVLELAATKWNMGLFSPSLGAGGHCIPVAPRHILKGATCKQELSIVDSAVTDRLRVVKSIIEYLKSSNISRVLVLGISYRSNVKMVVCSCAVPLIRGLLQTGVKVDVIDPYFSPLEIRALTGGDPCESSEGDGSYDAIVLATDHDEFCFEGFASRVIERSCPRVLIDNSGRWKEHTDHFPQVCYVRVGGGMVGDTVAALEQKAVGT